MKKSKVNIGFFVIIILALLISVATYSFLDESHADIYVFNNDYDAGTVLRSDMLARQEMNRDMVMSVNYGGGQDGSFFITESQLSEVMDQPLRTDVKRGMPLMSNFIDSVGGSPVEKRLGNNKVALTVPVDNVTSSNPFLTHGSRVNIYASLSIEDAEDEDRDTTLLIFQNVRVLDVLYEEMMSERKGSPLLEGVTLEMDPEDSAAVMYAAEYGNIRLATVKTGAYQEIDSMPFIEHNYVNRIQMEELINQVQEETPEGEEETADDNQ